MSGIYTLFLIITNVFSRHESIRIQDKNGRNVVLLGVQMPEHLRKHILTNFRNVFPNCLETTDSAADGRQHTYPCAHYVWYNRCATRVSGSLLYPHYVWV